MVTQELVGAILEEYKQNSTKAQMKEHLIAQGWEEADIADGIRQVQHMALEQLPVVGFLLRSFVRLEQKMTMLSPRTAIFLLLGIGVIVLGLAVTFSLGLSFAEKAAAERDKIREEHIAQLHTGIENFYQNQQRYPKELQELIPTYLEKIPVDPQSRMPYEYILSNDGGSYDLCTHFELRTFDCAFLSGEPIMPMVNSTNSINSNNSSTNSSTLTPTVPFVIQYAQPSVPVNGTGVPFAQ